MKKQEFLGVNCLEIDFGEILILVTESVGPRIISLKYRNSGNIFAELPNDFLEFPGNEKFIFYGGHRLWVAPEIPSVTYSPDNLPVTVNQKLEYTELIQDIDLHTGIRKTIRIQQTNFKDVIIIDHLIKNESSIDNKFAPWAITQMKLGGTAILPLKSKNTKNNLLLPNGSIILWPYTDILDPRIYLNKDFIFIHTEPTDKNPIKIGIANLQQWIAYYIENILFIKYSNNFGPDCSLDMGASGQCYCNDRFIELETLGLYEVIKPGATIKHREIWRLVEVPFIILTPEELKDFVINDKMADICRGML